MNTIIHGLRRAALVLLLPPFAFAQEPARLPDGHVWRQVPGEAAGLGFTSAAQPSVYELDEAGLDSLLARAPEEFSTVFARSPVLSLPMPDGSLASFRVIASTILEGELAARFPTIRTFLLEGLDEATPRGRLDLNRRGLHALVLTREGAVRIDPDDRLGPPYYRSTFETSTEMSALGAPFCQTREQDAPTLAGAADGGAGMHDSAPRRPTKGNPSGETLRLYRLAVATTGEYYADHGSDDERVMAAIVTVINRVNLIFETEVAVRFVLIGDNPRLLFNDPDGDGYSNHQPCLMQAENTPILNATVGAGSYDVGHVFGSAPGGGCAAGSVVCRTSSKGHGASSLSTVDTPIGVSAYRIVAHHLAHQFGAHHTWSGAAGRCIPEQFHAGSAYEPLSGTTLMAYPGDCGVDDLAATAADLYFHTRSFDQIVDFVTSEQGESCATRVATGNRAPLVDAGPDFTIPRETPFRLEGGATDPEGGSLTYSWEQFDAAPERISPLVDRGDNPLFRSFPPRPGDAARTLPRLSALLANTPSPGEILPTTDRTLDFRLTARDGRGGVDHDSMRITVGGRPFELISPNGGETLATGCPIPVLWDVGGGSVAGEVDILLSEDGGESNTLLARAVNDGAHEVSTCTTTDRGRLELAAVDQIFFDLSDGDFNIASAAPRISAEASGGVVDESCKARVTFSALATDDCGIDAESVSVAVKPLADTFIPGEPEITFTQLDDLTVSVEGSVPVTGLTAESATLELDFLAMDRCGLATTRTVTATVAGSDQISGAITSPEDCQCFGPRELPVTVEDSFASTCSDLTRIYSPAPPPFLGHGDHDVTLTVEAGGASAADEVSFTIDLVPPGLEILSPEATTYNGMAALPIPIRFTSRDDDGAAGGVVHERILLDGEVLFDGEELGDRDGRLSDELPNLESSGELALDLATLCTSASGLHGFHTLTVEAEDCGGNLGEVSVAFEISLPNPVCQVVERHTLVINELDYDQGPVDGGEFVEIKNTGSEAVDLRDYALRTVYFAPFDTQPRSVRYAIETASLEPGGYFVICSDDNPGDDCDQRVSPTGYGFVVPELLRERTAAAAVALVYNPLRTPRNDRLIDSVCYFDADHLESDQGVPGGIAGGKWTETLCNNQLESEPGTGISRLRDGQDRDHNRVDFRQACITPGAANLASARGCDTGGQALGRLVINELDNQPEAADSGEFIEIKNVGERAVNLGDYQLVHRRLGADGMEARWTLPEVVLAPDQLFVVCRSSDAVPGCDADGLVPLDDTSGAVALTHNVSGQAVHDLLIDSIAYGELDDANTGGPLSGGSWAEGAPEDERDDEPGVGLSRACDSTDTDDNAIDFRLVPLTPGAENAVANIRGFCASRSRLPEQKGPHGNSHGGS